MTKRGSFAISELGNGRGLEFTRALPLVYRISPRWDRSGLAQESKMNNRHSSIILVISETHGKI